MPYSSETEFISQSILLIFFHRQWVRDKYLYLYNILFPISTSMTSFTVYYETLQKIHTHAQHKRFTDVNKLDTQVLQNLSWFINVHVRYFPHFPVCNNK